MNAKLAFLLLLITSNSFSQSFGSFAGANDWVKVGEILGEDIYIQQSSVRPITNQQITTKGYSIIDMSNYKGNTSDSSSLPKSVVRMSFVDCANPGYKVNGGKTYKQYLANGVGVDFGGASWVDIQKANDTTKIIYRAMCVR